MLTTMTPPGFGYDSWLSLFTEFVRKCCQFLRLWTSQKVLMRKDWLPIGDGSWRGNKGRHIPVLKNRQEKGSSVLIPSLVGWKLSVVLINFGCGTLHNVHIVQLDPPYSKIPCIWYRGINYPPLGGNLSFFPQLKILNHFLAWHDDSSVLDVPILGSQSSQAKP